MKRLSFDEFRHLIDNINYPAQRVGIIRIKINNNNKRYYFEGLKLTGSFNDDLTGFSLNHYDSLALPKQSFKQSKFHSYGNVCIDVWRHEFKYAIKVENRTELDIITKNWTAQVNW